MTTYLEQFDVGTYDVVEDARTGWFNTDPADGSRTKSATVVANGTATLYFGNVCVGQARGGLTLGFWSNKNGQALIGSDDLTQLRDLNLRGPSGADFDPTNYAAFRTWLLNGNAVDMAYMLSVQLAAMKMNVYNGKVVGTALIYAPGTTSANSLGFATVNDVIAEANASLGSYPGDRAYQEALKNALDNANNNRNFVGSVTFCLTGTELSVID
jgi:hypothetical protein